MDPEIRMAALHLFRQRYGIAADPEKYPVLWEQALSDAESYIEEEA